MNHEIYERSEKHENFCLSLSLTGYSFALFLFFVIFVFQFALIHIGRNSQFLACDYSGE